MDKKVTDTKEFMLHCGKRVKECREAAGYTQSELATALETLPENNGKTRSEKHISAIERGSRCLSIEYAKLISKVLKVDEDYLLCKSDYKTIEDWFDHIGKENELLKKNVLYMLRVLGITISEPLEKELVGIELEYYKKEFEAIGLIPSRPHKNVVYVQIGNEEPQEMDAKEIYGFIENIIEFADFQAKKIRKRLNEDRPIDQLLDDV